ncbi:unnamed protein product [Ostreobium quekettii]|uniref:adenylate kinase n=1 Tax=Ostreobium quekettii TaxID=121088 RepID=A0A8S1JBH0_9CHLO|nr:unnamed protein product [Ostreobium quekettii]
MSQGNASTGVTVFVLGGPGSGKGTQCAKAVAKYGGWAHLSTGDLLREEVASGSETGAACDALMQEGKMVPDDITIGLLKAAMQKSSASKFLLDGFPRELSQVGHFEQQVGHGCDCVAFFDASEEVLQERLLKRGETSGRADDNVETIQKRFAAFRTCTQPVIDEFRSTGKLHTISAEPPPDDVFAEFCKVIDELEQKSTECENPPEETLVSPTTTFADGSVDADAKGDEVQSTSPDGNQEAEAVSAREQADVDPKTEAEADGETAEVDADDMAASKPRSEIGGEAGDILAEPDAQAAANGVAANVGEEAEAGVTGELVTVNGKTKATASPATDVQADDSGAAVDGNVVQEATASLKPVTEADVGDNCVEAGAGPTNGSEEDADAAGAEAGVPAKPESDPELDPETGDNGKTADIKGASEVDAHTDSHAKGDGEADCPGDAVVDVNGGIDGPVHMDTTENEGCEDVAFRHDDSEQVATEGGETVAHKGATTLEAEETTKTPAQSQPVLHQGSDVRKLPTEQYMDCTVVPVLREALRELNTKRPNDPLQFLANYLMQHKTLNERTI